MSNHQNIEQIVDTLEQRFGADAVYDYFSAFHDVVVLGHTSSQDDNPHAPSEQPSHRLYHTGAVAAERLVQALEDGESGQPPNGLFPETK